MFCKHSDRGSGFVNQFDGLFGSVLGEFESLQDPGRRPKPKLSASDLLASLVYHVMSGAGIFSAHVYELFGVEIKDSSLSERRQRIGLGPFSWLMKHALKPLADGRTHKNCFYKGWRLCGIDGSRWSVTNTPQILEYFSQGTRAPHEGRRRPGQSHPGDCGAGSGGLVDGLLNNRRTTQ